MNQWVYNTWHSSDGILHTPSTYPYLGSAVVPEPVFVYGFGHSTSTIWSCEFIIIVMIIVLRFLSTYSHDKHSRWSAHDPPKGNPKKLSLRKLFCFGCFQRSLERNSIRRPTHRHTSITSRWCYPLHSTWVVWLDTCVLNKFCLWFQFFTCTQQVRSCIVDISVIEEEDECLRWRSST